MTSSPLAAQIKSLAELKGQFRLRSGTVSDTYFDKYRFESQPAVLAKIAEQMRAKLPAGIDRIAGLELGGVPLATAISLQAGIPCLFVRKEAKPYGTCNAVEGGFEAGERVVIIEDVVTSGGAVLDAIDMLRGVGLVVEDVICAIDREAGGREAIEQKDCRLTSVFTRSDLSD